MKRDDIWEKLKEILLQAKGSDCPQDFCLTEETELSSGLGLSSYKLLYAAITVEETFGIRFEKDSYRNFARAGELLDYIEKKLENQ